MNATNPRTTTPAPSIDWDAALSDYRECRGALRSFQREHYETASEEAYRDIQERFDELASAAGGAMRALLLLNAPTLSAAAIKARIAAEEHTYDLVIGATVAQAIAADLERLARS